MFNRVKRFAKNLRRDTSGNTMMLFALGMPVFMGGAGLAVDTAQWYEWQREMQYAVDQGAMAAAWSKVGGSTGETYKTRGAQEVAANLQIVNFQGTPTVNLAGYAGGTNNSVVVTLSATKSLPFSSMLTGHGTTINVSAQAAFEKGRTFTACLIAVDPTTSGAITINGNAYVIAQCGAAALSNATEAISYNGSGEFNVGYLVAAGGIDQDLAGTFTDSQTGQQYTNVVYENQTGLVDPFAGLTPPDNPTPRTYACTPAGTDYTAFYTETTTVKDLKYTSTSANGPWTLSSTITVSTASQSGSQPGTETTKKGDVLWDNSSTAPGTVVSTPATTTCNKQGKNCTTTPASYSRTDRVTNKKAVVDSTGSKGRNLTAKMQPGTYTDFTTACDTTMAPGVYVLNGGQFKVNSQYNLIAPGVMLVLKNGASIDINGGASLNMRAMTTTEMISAGIPEADALKLKDMLIFEDRSSTGAGSSGDKLNGNAGAIFEGIVYLPKSDVTFNGTFGVTSRCLVIASKTITIGGTANMSTFCPPGITNTISVGGGVTSVRLVA